MQRVGEWETLYCIQFNPIERVALVWALIPSQLLPFTLLQQNILPLFNKLDDSFSLLYILQTAQIEMKLLKGKLIKFTTKKFAFLNWSVDANL